MLIQQKTSSASIANQLKRQSSSRFNWQIKYKRVCASSEIELANWLLEKPLITNQPKVFFAERQRKGMGQRGRFWFSPKGGVWLSAALPCLKNNYSARLLGLAVAFSLAERLDKKKIQTKIKWPNDLFFANKKLAGFLPKLIYRGNSLRFVRIGVGLNVLNRTPPNGVSLSNALGLKNLHLAEWSAEVLMALENAIELCEQDKYFYLEVEKRLLKKDIFDNNSNMKWEVDGLESNGSLRLKSGNKKIIYDR